MNYRAIIESYGFNRHNYDFETSLRKMEHDIAMAIFDSRSNCFDTDRIELIHKPNDLNCMLLCELHTLPGIRLSHATNFLYQKWLLELRYPNAKYENVEVRTLGNTTVMHCLCIAAKMVCSVKFLINGSS